jgi:hypothetical protein
MENQKIENLIKLSKYANSIGLSIDYLELGEAVSLQRQIEALIKCKLALVEMENQQETQQ